MRGDSVDASDATNAANAANAGGEQPINVQVQKGHRPVNLNHYYSCQFAAKWW